MEDDRFATRVKEIVLQALLTEEFQEVLQSKTVKPQSGLDLSLNSPLQSAPATVPSIQHHGGTNSSKGTHAINFRCLSVLRYCTYVILYVLEHDEVEQLLLLMIPISVGI